GEAEGGTGSEIDELRRKLEQAKPPELVMKEAERELNRLESIPSASPEYGVIRTWLQIVSELPWSNATIDKIDLVEARKVLDRGHFDIDKVNRRISEYLAVLKLKQRNRALAKPLATQAKAATAANVANVPNAPPPDAVSADGAPDDDKTVEGNLGEENVGG